MERAIGREIQLTQRERQCLDCVADGLVTSEIAEKLEIQERTVSSHIGNILRKLSCNTRSEAVAHGFRLGLLK